MRKTIILFISLILISGCASESEQNTDAAHKSENRTVLCKIKTLTKAEFLIEVAKSDKLNDNDKKAIQKAVSIDVYSHCKLIKYKSEDKLFMELDQFYPRKELGKDAEGHTLVEGGSGSLDKFEMNEGKWWAGGGMNYD